VRRAADIHYNNRQKVGDMSNGDRMSLAEGAHMAGMALLLAFAAAFILSSARAAKPADGQDLPEIIQALIAAGAGATLQWRDLEASLRARWSEAAAAVRPPGLEQASTVRSAQVPSRLPAEGAKRRQDNWQIMAWGSAQAPRAISVTRDVSDAAGTGLEDALRTSGVPFMIECETPTVRHYRLGGRKGAYAAQYAVQGRQEIVFFWAVPPEALLRRDGCLITSVTR
jgi:hypothetical protein